MKSPYTSLKVHLKADLSHIKQAFTMSYSPEPQCNISWFKEKKYTNNLTIQLFHAQSTMLCV